MKRRQRERSARPPRGEQSLRGRCCSRASIAAKMTKTQVGIGCVGMVVGLVVGGMLGALSAYAIASLVTSSRETQAYLTLLVVPAVAVAGVVSGGALALAVARRRTAPLVVGLVGGAVLVGVLALGALWHRRSKPGELRVRNETSVDFENLYVGGDFRRSTRIGGLASGETSAAVPIDLDEPGTFDALEGRAGGSFVRHRLGGSEREGLESGDYLWTVRDGADGFAYAFERQ